MKNPLKEYEDRFHPVMEAVRSLAGQLLGAGVWIGLPLDAQLFPPDMSPEEMASHRPVVVICDERNGIAEMLRYDPASAEIAGVSGSG